MEDFNMNLKETMRNKKSIKNNASEREALTRVQETAVTESVSADFGVQNNNETLGLDVNNKAMSRQVRKNKKGGMKPKGFWQMAGIVALAVCLVAVVTLGIVPLNTNVTDNITYNIVEANDQAVVDWQNAISLSMADSDDRQRTVRLTADWGAAADGSYTTSFGSGTGFQDGALLVPAGTNIVLDLNGRTLSRNLTGGRANGLVIYVYGKLTIRDTSASKLGIITGAYTTSQDQGSITVYDNGQLEFEGGTLTGNYASCNSYVYYATAGITVWDFAEVNMYPGAVVSGNTAYNYGVAGVTSYGEFNATGGAINGNTAQYYAGLVMTADSDSWSRMDVKNMSICNNHVVNIGTRPSNCGVMIADGTATFDNVTVDGNTGENGSNMGMLIKSDDPILIKNSRLNNNVINDGTTVDANACAGLVVWSNSTDVRVESTTIDNNYAASSVWIDAGSNSSYYGKLTMIDCNITNNRLASNEWSIIEVNPRCELIMEGCTVTGNNGFIEDAYNSGLFPGNHIISTIPSNYDSSISLKDCTISGNTVPTSDISKEWLLPAICISAGTTLKLSGYNYIYDNLNTQGEQSNVWLWGTNREAMIEIEGVIPTSSVIGISSILSGQITRGWQDYNGTADPLNVFVNNEADFEYYFSEIYADTFDDGEGNMKLELGSMGMDGSSQWEYAVKQSLAHNGATYTVQLLSDWESDRSYSFGSDEQCFYNGMAWVPEGASIILDLNGYSVNRRLTSRRNYGGVVVVDGIFTLRDTSGKPDEELGCITGGFNQTQYIGAGVTVAATPGATFNFESGWIAGNASGLSNASYPGGPTAVSVFEGATFNMFGGYISENYGNNTNNTTYHQPTIGVYGEEGNPGVFNMTGGSIQDNALTLAMLLAYTYSEVNITGGEIKRNYAQNTSHGVLIATEPFATVNISNIKIYENSAVRGDLINNYGSLTLDHVEFTENTASVKNMGGTNIIYNATTDDSRNPVLTITNCTFTKNEFNMALVYNDDGDFVMDNCDIVENTSLTGYMLAFMQDMRDNTASVTNSHFIKNASSYSLMYSYISGMSGGSLTVSGCEIRENTSDTQDILNMDSGELTDCVITGNAAYQSIIVSSSGIAGDVLTIRECTITDNEMYEHSVSNSKTDIGHIISVDHIDNLIGATVDIIDTTITGNRAGKSSKDSTGGNIIAVFGNLKLTNVEISNNSTAGCSDIVGYKTTGTVSIGGKILLYDNAINEASELAALGDNRESNLCFDDSTAIITIHSALASGSKIAVWRGGNGVLTNGYGRFHSADPWDTYFINEYKIRADEMGWTSVENTTLGSGSTYEAAERNLDPAQIWEYAVKSSLRDGVFYTARLEGDWTARSGSFGTDELAYYVGALYVPEGAKVILDLNGHTVNRAINSVRSNGGVIYVDGEFILMDSSSTDEDDWGGVTGGNNCSTDHGSAITVSGTNSTFTFKSGHIYSNKSGYYNGNLKAGSTIEVYPDATFNMEGGVISGNIASTNGNYRTEVIRVQGTFNMTGGAIRNNSSGAGTISVYAGANLSISNAEISGNSSQADAFNFDGDDDDPSLDTAINITNTEISGNSVTLAGNHLIYTERNLNLNQVTFDGNNIARGHLINNQGDRDLRTVMDDCKFLNNTIPWYIDYFLFALNGYVNLNNCEFSGNEAFGIMWLNSYNYTAETWSPNSVVNNCNINNNVTAYQIFAIDAKVDVTGGTQIKNNERTAQKNNGSIFETEISETFDRTDVNITVITVDGCTVEDNFTATGGAYINRGTIIIKNSAINRNTSVGNYAIFGMADEYSKYVFENVTMTGNDSTGTSRWQGENDLIKVNGIVELKNVEFKNNIGPVAIQEGGRLSLDGKIVITDNQLTNSTHPTLSDADIYFVGSDDLIEIKGRLDSNSKIGIYREFTGVFTQNYGAFNNPTLPTTYFYSDDTGMSAVITNGTGTLMEAATLSSDPSSNWVYAVQSSLRAYNSTGVVTPFMCELFSDMTASSGSFGSISDCYINGMLYVPANAHVILEMNGYNVDRKLTSYRAWGGLFYVEGILEIRNKGRDMSDEEYTKYNWGNLTGGLNNTQYLAGGITVADKGQVTIDAFYHFENTPGYDGFGRSDWGISIYNNKTNVNNTSGGVYMYSNYGTDAKFEMRGGTVYGNYTSGGSTGGIGHFGGTLILDDVLIYGNSAPNGVAALETNVAYRQSGDLPDSRLKLSMNNVIFQENSGAHMIYLSDWEDSDEVFKISNITLRGNTSTRYSNIYADYFAKVEIDGFNFSENATTKVTNTANMLIKVNWGASVKMTGKEEGGFNIIKDNTVNCLVEVGDGTMDGINTSFELSDAEITGNVCTGTNWSIIGNHGWTYLKNVNIHDNGGTAFSTSGSSPNFNDVLYDAYHAKLEGVTIANNWCIIAPVVVDDYFAPVELEMVNCIVESNEAKWAGALANNHRYNITPWAAAGAVINITGGKFANNRQTTNTSGAGAILLNYTMDVTVTNTVIEGNYGQTAGAINMWGQRYTDGKPNNNITLNDVKLLNNTAWETGDWSAGAIYADDHVNINGGEISGNTGAKAGGVYIDSDMRCEFNNVLITNNTATSTEGAGGLYIGYISEPTSALLHNTTIKNNVGALAGGVYVTDESEIQVSGTTFVQDNKNASGDAGKTVNVYFENDEAKIKVVGQLQAPAKIGLLRTAINVFTDGYGLTNYYGPGAPEPTEFFTSDSQKAVVVTYGSGTGMEGSMFSLDNALNWSNAVAASLAENGATKTFTMFIDWEAEPDSTHVTSFGDAVGYRYGALYVPAGASIILDLKGYKLNRNLSNAAAHGYVIWVEGELIIRDSGPFDGSNLPDGVTPSTRDMGEITGGNNSSASDGAGGIVVVDGKLRLEGGRITQNFGIGTNVFGGVYVDPTSTFTMTGGEICKNTGTWAGGLYVDCAEVTLIGGKIYENQSTHTLGGGGVFVPYSDGSLRQDRVVKLGGSIQIKDNVNYGGLKSNLYIQPGNEELIRVVSQFTTGAEVYVSRSAVGVFTDGYSNFNGGITSRNYFKSDNSTYSVDDEEINGTIEASLICTDGAINWSYAVKTSLEQNGAQKTVRLYEDWLATDLSFGNDVGFSSGRLYVPAGANVVLDLAGRKVDRQVIQVMSNGSVLYIAGTLTIIDSVGGGSIEGGFSDGTGGIFISAGGTLNFEGGTVKNNKSTASANAAGINVAGTLNLKGGSVTENYGRGNGGIYVESTGVINIGGTRAFPDCPVTVSEVFDNKIEDGTGAYTVQSNIELVGETAKINILSALQNTHKYGVKREYLGAFTSGFGMSMSTATASNYFIAEPLESDGGKFYVGQVGSGSTTEAVMLTDDNSLNWSFAVKTSLEQGGTKQTVTLNKNWLADSDPNAYYKSFGPDNKPGFERGALYVPAGANIVLDLRGFTVDRDYASLATQEHPVEGPFTYGYVFNIVGTFEIIDSVGGGIVTGGMNSTPARAGGIQVNGGDFTLTGGSIQGNKSYGNGSVGGIVVSSGTFTMRGGKVINNYSGADNGVGGVYIAPNVTMNLGGKSDIYGNTIASEDEEGNPISINSNLYIDSEDARINIITDAQGGRFEPTQPIGITRPGLGAFTSGYGPINGNAGAVGAIAPNQCFKSEDPIFNVKGEIVDGYYECIMDTDDNAMRWTHAVLTSLATGKTQEFDLRLDGWTATYHRSYTTAFGTNANAYYYGALWVPEGASIILNLNGRTLDRALSGRVRNGAVIFVDGALTITDMTDAKLGSIVGGRNNTGAGAIIIDAGGTVKFESGTITNCSGTTSGGVAVSNGTFTLTGATITENWGNNSGAVYVGNYGKFNMNGGIISLNSGDSAGGVYTAGEFIMESALNSSAFGRIEQNEGLVGGVYVAPGGNFILRNGILSNNTGTSTGGVYLYNSANALFTMEGGSISNNNGIAAGGVYAAGVLKMTGGLINANTASGTSRTTGGGGGVYIPGTGTFTMLGGSITGNIGMNGVRAYSSAILNMGGSAKVTSNQSLEGESCNVYLSIPSRKINIVSEFIEGQASIYVTRDSAGVFTSGYGENNTMLPMKVFASDKPQYAVSVATVDKGDGTNTIEATIGTPIASPVDVTESVDIIYNSQQQVVITGYNDRYMSVELPNGTFLNGSTISAVNAGEYTVVFKLRDGFCWSNGKNEDLQLHVLIRPFVVTLSWTGDEYTYDGEVHTPTAEVTNLFPGDVCGVTVDGGQINAGNYSGDTAAVAAALSNGNYALYDETLPGASPAMRPTHNFVINKATIVPVITTLDAEFGKDLTLKISGNIGNAPVRYYLTDSDGNNRVEIENGIFKPTADHVLAGIVYVVAEVDNTNNTFAASTPVTPIAVNKGYAPLELEETEVTYGDGLNFTLKEYPYATNANLRYSVVGGTGVLQITGQYGMALQAGTVILEISIDGNSYYKDTVVTTTITVKQKPVELDWDNLYFVYDGYIHVPTATVKPECIIGTDVVTVTVAGGRSDAGTHTAKAVVLSNRNYTLVGESNYGEHDFEIERADIKVEIVKDEVDQFNNPTGYVGAVYGTVKELKLKITANILGNANYDVTNMFTAESMHFQIAKIDNPAQASTIPESAFQDIDGIMLTPPSTGWFVLRAQVDETTNFHASDKMENNVWAVAILHIKEGEANFKLEKTQYEYGTETKLDFEGLDDTTTVNISIRQYAGENSPIGNAFIVSGNKILPTRLGWVTIVVDVVNSTNYKFPKTMTFDVEIVPKTLTITWTNTELTYNAAEQFAEYTIDKYGTDDVKLDLKAYDENGNLVSPINVGTYNALVVGLTGAQAGNYRLPVIEDEDGNALDITKEYSIGKKSVTLSWRDFVDASTPIVLEYTAEDQTPRLIINGLVPNDECTPIINGAKKYPNPAEMPTYTAEFEGLSNENYEYEFVSGQSATVLFVIENPTLVINLKENRVEYGHTLELEAVCTNGKGDVIVDVGNITFEVVSASTGARIDNDNELTPLSFSTITVRVTVEGTDLVPGGYHDCYVYVVRGSAPIELKDQYAYYGTEYTVDIKDLFDGGDKVTVRSFRIEGIVGSAGSADVLGGNKIMPTHVGKIAVYIKVNGTAHYDGEIYYADLASTPEIRVELDILPRLAVLEWAGDSYNYDGRKHCPIAVVSNRIGQDVVNVTVKDAQINAGTYNAHAVLLDNVNYCLFDPVREYEAMLNGTTGDVDSLPFPESLYPDHTFVINKIDLADDGREEATITNETVTIGFPEQIEFNGLIDPVGILYSVVDGTGSATISTDGLLTPTSAGKVVVRAFITERNYNSYWVDKEIIIQKNTERFELVEKEVIYGDDLILELTGGYSGGANVTYTISAGGTGSATIVGNVLTPVSVGTINIFIDAESTGNFAGGQRMDTITIKPRIVEIEWTYPDGEGAYPFVYNGTVQHPTATITNLVAGDACDLIIDATKDAGDHTATATGTTNSNYTVENTANPTADYTILQYQVSITWEIHRIDGEYGDRVYYFTSEEIAPKAFIDFVYPGDVCEVIVRGGQVDVSPDYYDAYAFELTNQNYTLDGVENRDTTFRIIMAHITPVLTTTDAYYGEDLELEVSGNIGNGKVHYYLLDDDGNISVDENGEPIELADGIFTPTPADVLKGSVKVIVRIEGTDNTYSYPDPYPTTADHTGEVEFTININKGKLPIKLSVSQAVYGTPINFTVLGNLEEQNITLTVVDGTGSAYITNDGVSVAHNTVFEITPTKAGTVTINVKIDATDLYEAVDLDIEFTVLPRAVILAWTYPELTYNGEEQVPEATVTNKANPTDECVVVVSGQIDAGSDCEAKAIEIRNLDGSINGNYTVEGGVNITTTYAIKPKPVTISWGNTILAFSGEDQAPVATIIGLVGDDECEAIIEGKELNVGTGYVAKVTGLSNSNYTIDGGVNLEIGFVIEVADIQIQIITLYTVMGQELKLEVSGNIGNGVETYQLLGGGTGRAIIEFRPDASRAGGAGSYYLVPQATGTVRVAAYVQATPNTTSASTDDDVLIDKADAPLEILTDYIEYGTTEKLQITNNLEFAQLEYSILGSSHTINGVNHNHGGRATIDQDGNITGTKAGTVCVSIYVHETANYNATTITKIITVNPRVIQLGWNNLEVTYNGQKQRPNVWVTNLISGDSVTIRLQGEAFTGYINAGIYEVEAYIYNTNSRASGNYTLSGVNPLNTFTIGKAQLEDITLKNKETTIDQDLLLELLNNYGGGTVTYSIAPDTGNATLVGTDILSPLRLGKVRVTIEVADSRNYNARTIEEIVDIGKEYAPLIYTGALETTYGQDLAITVEGVPEGASKMYDVRSETGSARISGSTLIPITAGTVTLLITSTATVDYQQTTLEVEIIINPIVVDLDWDPDYLEFLYDGEVHTPIAKVKDGYLINGDTCDVVVLGGAINAGTHTAEGSSLTNPNYTLEGAEHRTVDFIIVQNELNIEIITTQAVFGTDLQLLLSGNDGNGEITWTVENITGSALIDGGTSGNVGLLTPTNIGQVYVTATVAPSNNYGSATVSAVITISKMSSNMQFTAQPLEYGTSVDALTLITGLQESPNVTFTVVPGTGNASVEGTNIVPSQVGTITVTATVAATAHYDGAVLTATFQIAPRPVKLKWTGGPFTYNKTHQAPEAEVENLAFPTDVCTVTVSGGMHAGKNIVAKATALSNNNYTLEGGEFIETTYEIKPCVAILAWDTSEELIYNGSERKPKATVTNLYPGDDCDVIVMGVKDAGTNCIANAITLSNTNYTLEGCTTKTTTFEIKPRVAQIDWANLALVYTGELQTPEAIVTNAVPGDTFQMTYTGAEKYVNAVTGQPYYVVTLTGLGNSNYELAASETANFTIVPLEIEFNWNNLTLTYNGLEQGPTYTITNIKNSDDVVITFIGAGKNVGQYTVALDLSGADSANYTIKNTDLGVRYSIVAKDITVKVQSKDKYVVYTGEEVTTLTDWYTLEADAFVGDDAGKTVEELFTTTGLILNPRFLQNGNAVTAQENGDYAIEPVLVGGALAGNNNYTVTIVVSNEYGTLTIGAPQALKLSDDTIVQFITEFEEEEWGEFSYYRRTYAELGWTHGIDDIDLERIILGQIAPETSINTFLLSIESSQRSLIRLYDNTGTLIYNCGLPGDGIDAYELDDAEYYCIGTGWYIELMNVETVIETIYLSVLGDVDGDGLFAGGDGVAINSYLNGRNPLALMEYRLAAYLTNEGMIGGGDVVEINSILNGRSTLESHYYYAS